MLQEILKTEQKNMMIIPIKDKIAEYPQWAETDESLSFAYEA